MTLNRNDTTAGGMLALLAVLTVQTSIVLAFLAPRSP